MLKSERLWLLPADPVLAEAAAEYYVRNREFLRPFNPVREEIFYTAEYQRELLQQEQQSWAKKQSFRFYICLPEQTNRIIGLVGLNNVVWGAFCSCTLGYKLDKDYVNQGYMTEAVTLVSAYAFTELGLHRIEGNVMPRNLPSRRVLEKCGFENEGLSRYYLKINGVWEDHIHMVKLNWSMHE